MLLHYDENINKLTRCYITNINDSELISKLNTLDKTLEEYNKSLQETPNKIWYSQNCNSFAFYDPYLYSCVRRQRDGQINIYLCLNIKVCNKLITIMCAPIEAGFSIAFGLYLDSAPNDKASTIIQTYINQYCREENLNQLPNDSHYNPWCDVTFIGGEVSLDGNMYLVNSYEVITLCEPSEEHIFNYVYINDCNTYVLPTKGSTLIDDLVAPEFTPQTSSTQASGAEFRRLNITGSYRQLSEPPRINFPIPTPDEISMLERTFDQNTYNSFRTDVTNFMNELENEGLAMRELPDASILDELT